MLKLSRRALLVGALAPVLPRPSWAQSDEIRVISSGGFTAAYKILAPRFEQMTGKKIVSTRTTTPMRDSARSTRLSGRTTPGECKRGVCLDRALQAARDRGGGDAE